MVKLDKNKLKEILISYADVILFVILVEMKLLLAMSEILSKDYSFKALFFPTLSMVLIFAAFILLFKNKTKTKVLLIMDFLISGFLMADVIYYGYFKDILSIAAMTNGARLGGDSANSFTILKSVIKLRDFLFLADLILFIGLYRFYSKRERESFKLKSRFISFATVFMMGIIINGICIYNFSEDKPRLMATMSNKVFIVKNLGTTDYHILDIYNSVATSISSRQPIGDKRGKEIQVFLEGNVKENSNNFADVGKNKNLIVLQFESLQQFVINSKVNGNEVTPNLNRWINKSMYFDNFFYQVAEGNTADAEFMLNNSMYPAATGAAYFKYDKNSFTALPGNLKSQGYYTAAFHGNDESFWNRDKMYDKMGFDDFYGKSKLKFDDKLGMGLSDKSFLRQTINDIKTFKQPYFSFVITLSSHYPYNRDEKKYGNFDTGKYDGTLMGDYLTAVHYADAQVGWFLDQLEKEGMLDNTILMLYGDHNALPKNYSDKLFEYVNQKDKSDVNWYELQKVPMFIHFPKDANAGVNHTYTGEIDLYPTIANMFSLPKTNMMGKDMLNPTSQRVIFRNGSFTNGKVFYVSWNDKYYDITTGKQITETDELKDLHEEADDELSYSDDILNHNLLKQFAPSK